MPLNLTVLIIDDDNDDQLMFCEVVGEINPNYSCLTASNGDQALTILSKLETLPDYIFLDLNMPRMSGKQCLTQIRNNEKFANVPVIIYSTSKLAQDREETKMLGATHFLTKPSSLEQLKCDLESIFEGKYENG